MIRPDNRKTPDHMTTTLQSKIAAAAARVSKAVKTPKGQPTVTAGGEAAIVEVPGHGRYYAGPKLDRYFSERDQFARLDAALEGNDKGTLDRPAFVAELRAIASQRTTIHAGRYAHLTKLADALEAGEPTGLLMRAVENTTNDARTYLGFALGEAERAPDAYTEYPADTARREAAARAGWGGPAVMHQTAMDVGPNRKVGG